MATTDHPSTPDSFTHVINLTSTPDSKISTVSVYSSRAEVTRIFRIQLKVGKNRVNISGLPNVLDDDTVRLEGRGLATIHDVSTAIDSQPAIQSMSPILDDLTVREGRIIKDLERCKTLHEALGRYLTTLHVEHVDIDKLDRIIQGYKTSCGNLDEDILVLEKQLYDIEEEIRRETEKERMNLSNQSRWLSKRVSLSLFAERETEVDILLTYAVSAAYWSALYELRVDMEARETPITLLYKAAIIQNTGEDWKSITLKLETATPSFGIELPSLFPWTLSVYNPLPPRDRDRECTSIHPTGEPIMTPHCGFHESRDVMLAPEIGFGGAAVALKGLSDTSKGNVSATFDVLGTMTIPCDNSAHHVTITTLKLDATMSWIAIPKSDTRTRLSAKIKNTSEYTLLVGAGSIYVDGSFISKSSIPAVSPGESFDCALGLDPAIRITYHPLSKKSSRSGFYSKTNVTTYTQRISIHNTKSIAVSNLRVVDQVPVSIDEKIAVKLINPPLSNVQTEASVAEKSVSFGNTKVKVASGVVAQWGDGTENEAAAGGEDATIVGKDGKLSWVCEVPAQTKIYLVLQWEVAAPEQVQISGL